MPATMGMTMRTTKQCIGYSPGTRVTIIAPGPFRTDFLTPESIRRECEASLKRLGVERIDLYQFHWPDETGTRVEDSWATMVDLVSEGKIRAAGVSTNSSLCRRPRRNMWSPSSLILR